MKELLGKGPANAGQPHAAFQMAETAFVLWPTQPQGAGCSPLRLACPVFSPAQGKSLCTYQTDNLLME